MKQLTAVVVPVSRPEAGRDAPASTCEHCTYWQPVIPDAVMGRCVHAWSDHLGSLILFSKGCHVFSTSYDVTLDTTDEPAWSVRR